MSDTATLVLPSEVVLLANGVADAAGTPTNRTIAFDAGSRTFFAGPPTIVARAGSRAISLDDGRFLLLDGMIDPTDLAPNCGSTIPAELFDPGRGAFVRIAGSPPAWSVTPVRAADGAVLLLGGTAADCTALRGVEAFVPGPDAFTVLGSGWLPEAPIDSAFPQADGTILLLTDRGLAILSLG